MNQTENMLQMIANLHAAGHGDEARKLEERLRLHNPDKAIPSSLTEERLAEFITVDPQMNELKDIVRRISLVDDPVLIRGETGTGKEILAKALHGSRGGPFETVNCAAIPEQLLESMLFGHTKGSFTGANEDKVGLMQHCFNGTLHLDEVGEMPMILQAKLLRALQEKLIRRIGENKEIKINCRIVASTNRDVKDSRIFRQDLYWRLSVFEVKTKPLRERLDDIPLLIEKIGEGKVPKTLLDETIAVVRNPMSIVKDKEHIEAVMNLTQSFALHFLEGNVRELQGIVRRYQVLGKI